MIFNFPKENESPELDNPLKNETPPGGRQKPKLGGWAPAQP